MAIELLRARGEEEGSFVNETGFGFVLKCICSAVSMSNATSCGGFRWNLKSSALKLLYVDVLESD